MHDLSEPRVGGGRGEWGTCEVLLGDLCDTGINISCCSTNLC